MTGPVITINPSTGQELARYPLMGEAQIEQILVSSETAFHPWRRAPLSERIQALLALGEQFRSRREQLATSVTVEMGKARKEALAEVDKCAAACLTVAEQFPKWQSELNLKLPTGHWITREPLGPILAIMPWNFPLWQVVRFAGPVLLSGNTVLLKHAPNTWGTARWLAEAFAQAFPANVYQGLEVDVAAIPQLIQDGRVRGVSLTGSRRAGMSVGALAGGALKKCVLELGGSDAYVILDDADLDLSAEVCASSRLLNAGQSCISAKRFLVTTANRAAFTERLVARMARRKMGDPTLDSTDFGPLARRDLRDQLAMQVEKSVQAGARVLLGGRAPTDQAGYFYPATVLTGVTPGQPAFDEELFGPVAAVIEVEDEVQALRLANQSPYGLGGALFSRNVVRARELARTELNAGMVWINDFVKSDPMIPFGGVKDSGMGRELGRDGAFEFTNIKTVFAAPS